MFEIKYRHYIRLNSQNEIIHAFSNAFEQPLDTDILFQETEQRHCQLQIMSEKYIGKYKYKYIDREVIEKSEDELYPIEERKLNKIKEIKEKSQNKILEKYPMWKQIDLLFKIGEKDTEAEKKNAVDFINTVRDKSDLLEIEVGKCNKKEDINNININF